MNNNKAFYCIMKTIIYRYLAFENILFPNSKFSINNSNLKETYAARQDVFTANLTTNVKREMIYIL